jgi:hypothetical protein
VASLDVTLTGRRLSGDTDIRGRVADSNLESWRLEIATLGTAAESAAWAVVAQGTQPLDGVLATLQAGNPAVPGNGPAHAGLPGQAGGHHYDVGVRCKRVITRAGNRVLIADYRRRVHEVKRLVWHKKAWRDHQCRFPNRVTVSPVGWSSFSTFTHWPPARRMNRPPDVN